MKKNWFTPKFIYSLLLTGFVSTLNAQIDMTNVREGESVEYCITHKKMAELKQNPAFYQQFIQDQQTIKNIEAQMKANPSPKRVVYTIPIVFHVLHDGGAGNISDEQIIDAVNILNRDYRLLNADAANVQPEFNASNPNHVAQPADIEIEFRLATKAPNGACFNGITRTFSTLTNSGGGATGGSAQVDAIKAGNDVYKGEWAGNKYLNVFVVSDAGGAAGYTMQPNNSSWGGGTTMKNGIWILSNYVGSIGTGNAQLSRALTHEVGHWLGLDHTWGPNNNPGNAASCNSDDGIADTPNTIGVTSCKLSENTCGPKANVENYMDYSYCSKMFTEGQRDKMRAAIVSSVGGRNNVISSANLVATGADGNAPLCKVLFSASETVVCVGTTVTFSDNSFNNVQTRTWEFEGGTPATSTAKYPQVTYATPGTYKVKLTVSDGTNSLDSVKLNYIVVQGAAQSLPFYEGFESYNSTADLTSYQIVNSVETSKTWELTTAAAKSGSKSIYINNFSQTGDIDAFISPNLDLSGISSSTGATLSYRYAASKKTSAVSTEFLKTYITNNCGESYVLRKTLTGNQLATAVSSSAWVPSASDWVTVHVPITATYLTNNFRFKLAYESKGGNNVYVDDINLYSGSASDDIVLATSSLSSNINAMNVYPNPANEELNVSFSAMNAGEYTVQIVDVVGKLISSYTIKANEGMNEVLLNTENLRTGSYFVRVSDKTNAKTLQFVKQ